MFSLFVQIHLSLPDCIFGNACVTASIAFTFLNLMQLLHSRVLPEQGSCSMKCRKTAQSHVSVRISAATDQFRICTKVKLICTIKIPTDFNSSVQSQTGWSLLAPLNTLPFKTTSPILFPERLTVVEAVTVGVAVRPSAEPECKQRPQKVF